MKYPSAKEVVLCWVPGTSKVEVIPLGMGWDIEESYSTGLGVYTGIQRMSFVQCKGHVFMEAMHLIIRDKCCPEAVHKALLNVEEYRDGCSDDMPNLNRRS